MKKETILTIVVCVLVVVSIVGIPLGYLIGQESKECPSCATPRYLVYECSNETTNWTSIQYAYGSVYPDSYEIRWSIKNTTTGEITPGRYTYCELTWNFDPIIIQNEP